MNRSGRGPGGYNNNSGQGNNTRIISIPAPTSATSANGLALTFIQDLRPNMRAFNLECILLDKGTSTERENMTLSKKGKWTITYCFVCFDL